VTKQIVPVRTLLLQLDSSPQPSVFDRVVALDAGADVVMSYGGVAADAVRDLVHGVIFTRGPKDLHHSAIFIGGSDMAIGERMLAAVKKSFFGPLKTSVMLDSNGSNTTAVAAVAKLQAAAGSVKGRRALVTAGTGPVGMRAAGLLAKAGAEVTVTSRRADRVAEAASTIAQRFGGVVRGVAVADPAQAAAALEGVELLISAGPAGVCLLPRSSWSSSRSGLRVAADLNAVPPLGVEGIEVNDNGVERDGVTVFGALGVGGLKMKIHKACIARLFERNDLVLDAETIAEVAADLATSRPQSA
jgi:methylenetetrahydrofolate/methylenetetrahydromethanopterin dehydrogenase (NADP+)